MSRNMKRSDTDIYSPPKARSSEMARVLHSSDTCTGIMDRQDEDLDASPFECTFTASASRKCTCS